MNEVVFKTLKSKDFIVKNYVFKVATELKLSLNEAILLIYFFNQEEPCLNIPNIKSTVYLTDEQIMEAFSKLVGIGLITVNGVRHEDGSMSEVINLDNILKTVTTDITKKQKEENNTTVFDNIEKEFGRPLSPMEFEVINDWLNSGTSVELINEALRETILNGVKSLRYMSSILLAWKEKGYKTKQDLSNGLYKEAESNVLSDMFDYDWTKDETRRSM